MFMFPTFSQFVNDRICCWMAAQPKIKSGKISSQFQVPGYREVSRELRCVSEEIEHQRFRSPEREMAPPTWLRNSPVGYVSSRSGGNLWTHTHYHSNTRFSRATTPMMTTCNGMDSVYRYYAQHRY